MIDYMLIERLLKTSHVSFGCRMHNQTLMKLPHLLILLFLTQSSATEPSIDCLPNLLKFHQSIVNFWIPQSIFEVLSKNTFSSWTYNWMLAEFKRFNSLTSDFCLWLPNPWLKGNRSQFLHDFSPSLRFSLPNTWLKVSQKLKIHLL